MNLTKHCILPLLTAVSMLGMLTGCSQKNEEAESEGIYQIADLEGKRIGTQIGTTAAIFAEDIADADLQSFTKPSAALKALRENKIDAIIVDSEPAKALTADSKDYRILSESFVQEEYSIAYAKENTELGQKINQALDTLKNNGTLEEITKHWVGEDADQVSYQSKGKATNGTLTMATNAEFPPYESKTTNGEIIGIDVDIMTAVCDELQMNLEIKDMQFDSILTSVQNGKADVGAAAISMTEEREKTVAFTQSYAVTDLVVIVRNE